MIDWLLFFLLINLILITRLRLMLRDRGAAPKDYIIMGGIPLIALLIFKINGSWFLLLGYLVLWPLIHAVAEYNLKKINRNRILMLVMHVVVIGFMAGPSVDLEYSGLFALFVHRIETLFIVSDYNVQWIHIQAFLFGLLMIMNEMNILVRYFLDISGLAPLGENSKTVDERQYNTGRVIGFLERIFIYLLVLMNQYTAVGFILTAKGVVRYPELGDRTFAEYILIGTLLSTLFAMAMAHFVKLFGL